MPISQHSVTNSEENQGTYDPYSALPPSNWDCSEYHPDEDPEAVQPGDEYFTICYDDGALVVIQDKDGYRGRINVTKMTVTVSEFYRGLAAVGMTVTRAADTSIPGEYTLRLRLLTNAEKDLLNDFYIK